MDFQVEPVVITPTAEGYLLRVKGSIHINTMWLEGEFKKVIDKKPKLVELDLTETPYVSSAGMTVLIELRKGVVAYGGTLRVIAIQKPVYGALHYAYLDKFLEIDP